MRIDVSSANFRAKSHFRVRTAERNPIFRCPPLRCPPLGPPEFSSLFSFCGFPFLGGAFLLCFPRISRVLQGGISLLFRGDPHFCCQKQQGLARPVSRQTCQQEIPGTPAGRPLFVPPRIPRTPGRCPEYFLNFMCLFSFLMNTQNAAHFAPAESPSQSLCRRRGDAKGE